MLFRFFALLVFSVLFRESSGAIFAVDLGSEFIKVSLIKPGRVPISIVHNELSKRKTPAAVGFHPTTRVYGEEALTLMSKAPDRVFLRTRDYLGRNETDSLLGQFFGKNADWKIPYKLSSDSKTVRFEVGESSFSVLEILGSLFSYIKTITETEAGEEVVDCVVAVPAFFGPVQKRALLDAARMADINVLAMINAHGAAALQYGIERDFDAVPQNVVIYDMGSNTIQASLISYTGYESLQRGRKSMIGQFEVKDVAWNENLGGDHLDWSLVHYFAKRFNEKFKVNLYESNRAVMKLKKAVSKAKHVLSANTEANFHVEELFDGIDFQDKIKRTEFESLNEDFFRKAVEPLTTLLERNQIDAKNLTAVELIGGGSRVPKIQSVLSKALGSRQLDRHLDGDEAVVMGSGLVAANLSTIFRLRKFGFVDGATYPMIMQVLEPKGWTPLPDLNVTSLFTPKALLPYMKRLPCKRAVHLHNISNAETFQFELKFDTSTGHPLPAGAKTDLYATYTVSGIKEAVKKLGGGGKITVHFVVDMSGLVDVDRAEYIVEVDEAIPAKETSVKNETNTTDAAKNATNTTERNSNETESTQQQQVETEKKEAQPEPEPVTTRKILKRSVVTVSDGVYVQEVLTLKEFRASKELLKKYKRQEAEKKATEEAKNALESFVVDIKSKLNDEFEIKEVTTEAERENLLKEFNTVEDWLYMDGADAEGSVFEGKLKELTKLITPVHFRAIEAVYRPASVEHAKSALGLIEKALNSWPSTRPWLKDDVIELAKQTYEFRDWLDEKIAKQEDLEPHEDPAFSSQEVNKKLEKLTKLMEKINRKRNPNPTPKPSEAKENITANATANATADSSAEATAEGTAKSKTKEEVKVEIEVDQTDKAEKTEEEILTDHIEL